MNRDVCMLFFLPSSPSSHIPIRKSFIHIVPGTYVCEWVSINRQKIISFGQRNIQFYVSYACVFFFLRLMRSFPFVLVVVIFFLSPFESLRISLLFQINIQCEVLCVLVCLCAYHIFSVFYSPFFVHSTLCFTPVNIWMCRFSHGFFGSHFFFRSSNNFKN